jgi:serine/threonine-protein kinase
MIPVDRTWLVAGCAVIGALCLPTPAHAQSAEAEVLFRDGRNLIKHGKLAAGCDKLGASERLESSVGTLLNLGDCREKLGMLASAWAAFRKAEATAKRAGGDDKRQAEAGRRAAMLEPRLSNLVIEVPQPVAGLVVHRDAEIVEQAQWSTAVPVDPGSYTIIAEAPGFSAWRTTVLVGPTTAGPGGLDGKRLVVTVPVLERTPVAAEPEPAVRSAPGREPAAPVMTMRGGGTWSAMRKLSIVAAVAGTGALGAGVYFGMHANDLRDRADQRCPLTVCADLEGLSLNDQAQTSARRATMLYIAGGATLATAMVLWLTGAPAETTVVPTAGAHQLGVAMTGSF